MDKIGFIEKLKKALDGLDWKPADLARHSGISAGHISRILSADQTPGIDNIVAIARAIKEKPEEVFRWLAGIEHREPEYSPLLEDWNEMFPQLSPEEQQELIDIAKLKVGRRNKTLQPNKKQTSRRGTPARSVLVDQ